MQSTFSLSSLKARCAGAAFAAVFSLACLSFVVLLFASASGELEPALAQVKPAAAKAAAVKAASQAKRG
ncbi:hypothetical protein [Aquabacterium humicola]|uniref:hypothetical protein n=1 Tax=Aquabacterium humicola TaxID=3237377 RepID=UPI002543C9E4|nr:hypothetical protein [Rubrivivax pictus]